jgi:hypothetical protein
MQQFGATTTTKGFSLEENQLFRFDVEKVPVEKAVLENDVLTFVGKAREVQLPNTLLEDFADLSEKESTAIREFANKWGRLGLCKHHLPATHTLPGVVRTEARLMCEEQPSEHVQDWRQWSKKFRILWRASMMLHVFEHADRQELEIIFPDADWPRDFWEGLSTKKLWEGKTYWESEDFSVEWGLLMEVLNYYIDLSGLRFRFRFDPSSNLSTIVPRISLGCPYRGRLFGVLATQLMFAASTTEGAAVCSACGLPFFPKRRPKAGQRRFCDRPLCGRKAANRHAARDFRKSHPNYRQQFD